MRVETLIESLPQILQLTDDEAAGLTALGRKLASHKPWWGARPPEDDDVSVTTSIRCAAAGDGQWSVAVDNAVGTVATGDLQLVIQPKIPTLHLLYLFSRTTAWPRLDESLAPLGSDESLMELVARWFLNAIERLLRGDLMRDYYETRDDLDAVRGRIDPLGTAQLFYSGRLAATCDFEIFDLDTPLNRVLKAAALAIVRNPEMTQESRKRAERIVLRMDDVGSFQVDDVRAVVERRTASYQDPFLLARHILSAEGRALAGGDVFARAFLISTPDLVEDGIRNVLIEALADVCVVKKQGRQLENSTMTINPDLGFAPLAVGDVKYKLNWNDWPRSDLYQSVAFAAGFRRVEALVVSFSDDLRQNLKSVCFGEIALRHVQWRAVPSMDVHVAKQRFVEDARAWWTAITRPSPSAGPLVLVEPPADGVLG
jgi:5-methylcytosine-specific restriction endonuclease McrBC regulatory subunit McrC